ncbi:ATP-binding protein [uncultured Algibacter sp.]|uniref:ATP-binding protein n=1 Tax=uncultured Algibacter sp. TaxID=298659 RepID=UPI002617E4F6|nr:ATP-binding protein [uncultured Algibacter sp.]
MNLYITILLEFLLISSSIILLFKYRAKIGLAPLYILLGSVQYLQANAGSSFKFELFDNYDIYPGSIILFSAVLFAILLIYIKEGVASARALIIGIIVSNIVMTLMFEIIYIQTQIGHVISNSPSGSDGYFNQNFKYFLLGTSILLVDFLFIIILYQYLLSKIKKISFFLVLFISLFTVLIFDAFVFNFFLYYGTEVFKTSLISHLFGKTIAAFVYAIILYMYLKYIDKEKSKSTTFIANQDRDVLSIIKYKQRYLNLKIEKEQVEYKLTGQLRRNLNQISDGFISLDSNWCYIYVNNRAAEFIGKSPDDLIGKNIWEVFPEGVNLPIYKEYHRAFEIQETVYFEDYYKPLDKWFENRVYPSKEGLTIYFTDITESKKGAIKSQLLLSLIETSDNFVGLATLEGKPLYLNSSGRQLVGIKEEELTGSITDFFPEKYKDKVIKEQMPRIYKDIKWKGEIEFNHFESGKLLPVEMSGFLIRDNNSNEPMALGVVASDISERKKAELELKKYRNNLEELVKLRTAELEKEKVKAQSADLMKSAFLASMSHELRTPMNSIIGFTGILLKEFAGPLNKEQKKQLGMVKNSSQHLLGLINDILDFSKIEAGKLKVSLHPFNYLITLEKTIDFLMPQAVKKGLVVNSEITEFDITLNSDERRVEQILINLISNAIKFSSEGIILVKVDVTDNFVVTQVIDQGIGIRKKDIDKLFEPFIQIDVGLNENQEGTGLGLTISKNLVEKLGGEIKVESIIGKGTNFTFTLPK